MALTIETLEESKWREGKVFTFLHSNDLLTDLSVENFVICVGSKNVTLKNISIEGDAETLTWKAYSDSEADEGTGTLLNPIPRNIAANTTPNMIVAVNPAITKQGTPFFDPAIQLVGQVAAGNRSFLTESIIGSPFTLLAGKCYTIEITNNSGSGFKYSIDFELWND